jgi:hypothetical protein
MEKIRSLFADIRVFLERSNSMLESVAISYAIRKIEDYLKTPNSIDALSTLATALMNCSTQLGYRCFHPLEYQFIHIVETGGQYISMWIRNLENERRDTFAEVMSKYAAYCLEYGNDHHNNTIIKLGQLLNHYVAEP